MTRLVVALALLALALPNAAVSKVHPVSIAEVDHMLDTVGPQATVDALYAGHSEDAADSRFDYVLAQIGKGKSAWIALAPRLASGTDGGNSLGIRVMLAQALPVNPVAVLRVVDLNDDNNILGVRYVCDVPFIETTQAFNDAYLRRTIPAVSRVRDADLAAKRDKCLARLKSL